MTAFGSGEISMDGFSWKTEIKTLNSRFLDVNIRLPRYLSSIEPDILSLAKKHLKRGKVDITFDIQIPAGEKKKPSLNREALSWYWQLSKEVADSIEQWDKDYQSNRPRINDFMRLEGVLEHQQSPTNDEVIAKHKPSLLKSVDAALLEVNKARLREGATLKVALLELLDALNDQRNRITSQLDSVNQAIFDGYKKRLEKFISHLSEPGKKLSDKLPEERLLAELAILAEKADIEEEITRLDAHRNSFLEELENGQEVGRKLDFLCQELHREVNTISNKLMSLEISKHTLTMKQCIEKLKQQIQNIE
tara:strand:- start:700 stop:1620 length:921 start_codon:yes stop_codon:yes gene_type:complete